MSNRNNAKGGGMTPSKKQPIKGSTEEEKDQYRMVSDLPELRHGQLLWQETQKNKTLTHLTLHPESPLLKIIGKRRGDREAVNAVRRIYTVHRRKEIRKDDLISDTRFCFGGEMKYPHVAKSVGVAARYFRELEIKTQQAQISR